MSKNLKSVSMRTAGLLGLGTLVVAAAAALVLRGAPAQAQGIMSAQACQCSVPTPISGMSSRIAHCMCGALSCAVMETSDPAGKGSSMQCVRQ